MHSSLLTRSPNSAVDCDLTDKALSKAGLVLVLLFNKRGWSGA